MKNQLFFFSRKRAETRGPLIPLSPEVLKVLDKFRRNFLWHGKKEHKGYNLVKWNIVQKSKEHGEGEEAKAKRDGGKLSQLAYGGPYGRKGMREFSKEDQTPFKRSKGNAFLLYDFGVKSNV
ncbi:hypothetical protein MTR67_039290 [Solanum verrucosum]|uniref:Uncharacterized protein n=1 Tax=Solanum verrucosum TaxID=315347 RepID=A0AAF0ZQI8_SOLVR|nr:hypothetical protein MTR67_039290 [Solanum verrucosum]